MKILIAFKKKPEDIIDRIIQWKTKSPYHHVEIILPGDDGSFENGYWISAKSNKGVRTKRLRTPLNNEKWDYLEVNVNKRYYKNVRTKVKKFLNYKYARIDLFLNFVLGIKGANTDDKMFCSELIMELLQEFHQPDVMRDDRYPVEFSPGDVFKLLTKNKRNRLIDPKLFKRS
jgi:hypothetical protein